MSFDIGFVLRAFPILAQGLITTLALAVPAVMLSAAWGVPLVVVLRSRKRGVGALARAYIEVVRNTPILVQMFFIYFGSGVLGYPLSGFVAGLLALVLQNGAYVAEIYRAGIQSVTYRQVEAGLVLGFMPGAAFRIVVLPQALRAVIPPLSNQGVLIIKRHFPCSHHLGGRIDLSGTPARRSHGRRVRDLLRVGPSSTSC